MTTPKKPYFDGFVVASVGSFKTLQRKVTMEKVLGIGNTVLS